MENVFIRVLNMGLTATWVVLAVLAVRALCHKAPKGLTVCLWAFVGLRLVCPFLAESILSLIPSAEIVSPDILLAEQPKIHTGVTMLNSTVNPIISEHLSPDYSVSGAITPIESANPMQVIAFMGAIVWIAGVAVMFAYSLSSYLWLRHKVKVSLC
jgi:beta-lactamase regulating signal transducer with metallopeptidase domain